MTTLCITAKSGKAAGYAPELKQLPGREPASFEQFAQDFENA
jgi:hypothetical protein